MSRKPPIDEIRTARALRKLAEHRATHPEAFDPARLPTTPAALAAAMGEVPRIGRPPSEDPTTSIGVRFPASMLDAIDGARGDRSRQEVGREAVERWLKSIKRRPRAG